MKRQKFVYTAQAGDNTNFVYIPKMEQKANFVYKAINKISLLTLRNFAYLADMRFSSSPKCLRHFAYPLCRCAKYYSGTSFFKKLDMKKP
jgi:hypothetical protein